jgi:hypothetical protein
MLSIRHIRAGLCLIFALSAAFVSAQTRLAAPSYQSPGNSTWNKWAAQGSASVGIMIVNLNSGDDMSYHSNVDSAIQKARKQGIEVLGYTYTGYGARNPATVRQRIDALYQNYLVDGIFFDEAPTDCNGSNTFFANNYLYYQELTNYVRQKVGARITVLNPGTISSGDCWMSITNILMNWENVSLPTYQSGYIDYPWVHQYPPDRFWHVILGVPQAQMQAAMNLAQARNAGWVYISDSATNAYNQVPVYWTAEATAVKQQGVQSLSATAWPDSTDSSGAILNGRISLHWRAVSGTVWQIFFDTDQDAATGYRSSQLSGGAEYMLECNSSRGAQLYRYAGSGSDWSWSPAPANAQITFPDPGSNLVVFDQEALAPSQALNYQVRSLDSNYNVLFTSYSVPLSLNNGGFVSDVMNHLQ